MRVALHIDTPNLEPLEPILDALEGLPIVAWLAPASFISLGPSVVHHLRLAGFDAFLDLRLSGEAVSIARAVDAVRRQGALGVTIELSAGARAISAAIAAARGRIEVIGVPGPLDSDCDATDWMHKARAVGLRTFFVNKQMMSSVIASDRCYVRSDAPVSSAHTLVVADRILASPDPRAACEVLFEELP